MPRNHDELPWPPPPHRPNRADLVAPATQIVRDREDYLGQGLHDVGRRIADDQVELFVTGDPAAAMQQQFDRLAPEFMALHDVGTSASLRLLGALAGSSGARVQRLSIRRQGHGVALAVLQFVEVPAADGSLVRIYSTDVNADTATRHALAMLLLARSRLGVLMLGELPLHALSTALSPLSESLVRGPWPNRDLLLLPLGSATAQAAHAVKLLGQGSVSVRATPQAARPHDAWAFISGAWNRLQGQAGDASATLNTDLAQALPRPEVPRLEAPTQAMHLAQSSTQPAAGLHAPIASASAVRWADYALRCAAVKGVIGVCIFDLGTQLPLAQAGHTPHPERLAIQGGLLIDAMADAARNVGLFADAAPEAAISIGQQHLVLHAVPGHKGVVAHLVLQCSSASLTLARMQIERVPAPGRA